MSTMSQLKIGRPEATEYTGYNPGYVSAVTGDDIISILQQQLDGMVTLLRGLSEDQRRVGDVADVEGTRLERLQHRGAAGRYLSPP